VSSSTEHQTYTEAAGVVIEGNRYGPMRTDAQGSQLKDRSSGTIVRYNYIEEGNGWAMDLVEPENSWSGTGATPAYGQDFVYGNVVVINPLPADWDNLIHWNEDHGANVGRAIASTHRLHLYHNTFVVVADALDHQWSPFHLVNANLGGWECPAYALNGRIDVRNNLIALQPRTTGAVPALQFGYCGRERLDFGVNWVSPSWTSGGTAEATGTAGIIPASGNTPGFVDLAAGDVRLVAGAAPVGQGAALSPDVTSNVLGLDLSPTRQYVLPHTLPTPTLAPRAQSGAGSDLGALER
jgi:hypothetical protein